MSPTATITMLRRNGILQPLAVGLGPFVGVFRKRLDNRKRAEKAEITYVDIWDGFVDDQVRDAKGQALSVRASVL
jgi:hypothetical protein